MLSRDGVGFIYILYRISIALMNVNAFPDLQANVSAVQ